jgi:hypothetical protein
VIISIPPHQSSKDPHIGPLAIVCRHKAAIRVVFNDEFAWGFATDETKLCVCVCVCVCTLTLTLKPQNFGKPLPYLPAPTRPEQRLHPNNNLVTVTNPWPYLSSIFLSHCKAHTPSNPITSWMYPVNPHSNSKVPQKSPKFLGQIQAISP